MAASTQPEDPYPALGGERTSWIERHRGGREPVDVWKPARALTETERSADGHEVNVHTLFLVNRECPWRCLMCDLWRHTTRYPTPPKAIPHQISTALQGLPPAEVLKLYNAGSFFDRRAIPPEDHPAIAAQCRPFRLTVVESHPALVGESALRFRDRLQGGLEVAMGLETVHPKVLPRLNKRMSLDQFRRAAQFLQASGIGLRVFVLLQPPFLTESEGLEWAGHSVNYAQDCGASVVVLIPTRPGNGALDNLQASGHFVPPRLENLEVAVAAGLRRKQGRVFADLWDLERFSRCPVCYSQRLARLRRMNLEQLVPAPVACYSCG